jgi:hypothetical protein
MKMTLIILFLSFLSNISDAQIIYSESGDTLIINSKRIMPGDTIRLGMGSSPMRDFLFIWQVPTKRNVSFNNNGAQPRYLSKLFSNGFLIYNGKMDEGNKSLPLPTPVFFLSGNKDFKYNIDLLSAIKTQEIVL